MNLNDLNEWIHDAYTDVDVDHFKSDEVPLGDVVVGGYVDSSLLFYDDNPITITLTAHPDTDEVLTPLDYIEGEVFTTYHHESRHIYQYHQKPQEHWINDHQREHLTDASYRRDPDEVDAYGTVDLAVFIQQYGWEAIWDHDSSPVLHYTEVLGRDAPEIQQIIKKAYKALDVLCDE